MLCEDFFFPNDNIFPWSYSELCVCVAGKCLPYCCGNGKRHGLFCSCYKRKQTGTKRRLWCVREGQQVCLCNLFSINKGRWNVISVMSTVSFKVMVYLELRRLCNVNKEQFIMKISTKLSNFYFFIEGNLKFKSLADGGY